MKIQKELRAFEAIAFGLIIIEIFNQISPLILISFSLSISNALKELGYLIVIIIIVLLPIIILKKWDVYL